MGEHTTLPDLASTSDNVLHLVKYQEYRQSLHINNAIFTILKDGTLNDDRARSRFLASLHQWASSYQRMLFLRQGFALGARWQAVFLKHLTEEIGHDQVLAREHNIRKTSDDPTLEALAGWFLYRMIVSDDLEKLVVMNLILERSAHVFNTHAQACFTSAYFSIHVSADEAHQNLGLSELKYIDDDTLDRLLTISGQAWDILELLLERIAQIVVK